MKNIDAIMDIGKFDDDRALNALLQIAENPNENTTILDACGESIVQIWIKRNQFDIKAYKNFQPCAQNAVNNILKQNGFHKFILNTQENKCM